MRALVVSLILLALPASAQADGPVADASDVASVDAILGAVYDVISGPSNQERDWDRFRSLMHPEARLMSVGVADGARTVRVMSVGDYVEVAGRAFREAPVFQGKGFYETEVARRVERYGGVAHVWSTYEARLDPAEAPFARGINSFQLSWDGSRWHVLSIFWEQETEATPIPDAYLTD